MKAIKRFINWIGRVPAGVWIILLLTQVFTLVTQPFEIADLQAEINELNGQPAFLSHQQWLINHVAEKQHDMKLSTASGILFLVLAIWRWRRAPPHSLVPPLRFTLKDLFSLIFFISLLLGGVALTKQIGALGLILFIVALVVSPLGILALLVGAAERKGRDDELKARKADQFTTQNSQS